MILHLSDLHFGTEKPECLVAIQRLCAEQQPEAVVVSGDLTQRARFHQFYQCRKFLDSLNVPCLIVPGNHDIPLYNVWSRLFEPFSRYHLLFGQTEKVLETQNFYMIGVNTIRRRHHTKGALSLSQIHEIDFKLQQAPIDKLKIIVAHQPFYVTDHHKRAIKDCPRMAKIALETWTKHGLFALLHGHLHQSAVYDLNQVFQLGLGQPIYDVHAGTATSYRLHKGHPNGLNIIHANGRMDEYLFNEASQNFELNQNLLK